MGDLYLSDAEFESVRDEYYMKAEKIETDLQAYIDNVKPLNSIRQRYEKKLIKLKNCVPTMPMQSV